MKMQTLDEFIVGSTTNWPNNAWVRERGFESLYVRVARRHLEGKLRVTIDIANVTARKPGRGTFTKLALEQRFRNKLVKWGFVEREGEPHNFYLLPDKELIL
jgi:hypothetical protein